jgi:glycosyltransferase involved in cell wall biosynthesis
VRILIDYRPALVQRTGVGEYIHCLTRALVRVSDGRDDIAVFASSWKDRLGDTAVPGARSIDLRIPARVLTRLWHQRGWPPVDWLAGGRYDVIQSSRPTLVPARSGARFLTVHDLDFLDHPERTQAEFRGDYGRLTRQHARQADRVVVISAYTAAEVEARLDIPRSRLVVCRPGRPEWSPPPVPPADPYVLFVGTLEPRKNVGRLLEAYARLVARWPAAPRLVLAGRTVPESAPVVEALKQPPLAGRATHIGYVPEAARESLFRNAAVLVLPSFNEGFGLPVLEAMTVGRPVVASNRGAIPEVLGDAGVLVNPDDVDELTAALERVLRDQGLAAALGARGVRRSTLFEWRTAAEALRASYEEAVGASRARRRRA